MADSKYQAGTTLGGKFGCATTAVLGVPLFLAGSMVAGLGGASTLEWLGTVTIAVIPAAAIGYAVRAIINKFRS